jgi:hypothetical protein
MRSRFQQGQTIVLREMWKGKIWSARPAIVVKDKPELMAYYVPVETVCMAHRASDGSRAAVINIAHSDWILKNPEPSSHDHLRVIVPDKGCSVIFFMNPADGSLQQWYVNMEQPLRRTAISYDYTDLFLDIIISPDLSEWRWDDEDELEEAVIAGLVSKEEAATLYTQGRRVVEWLQSGNSPCNEWEKWVPDPSWKTPVLPAGRDII